MTKSINYITSLAIMTVAFAVAASAQLPSLADVGHDVYTSTADGFEIAVPHGCVKLTNSETERTYTCDVKEGRIVVTVSVEGAPINTDADLAVYLKGFKDTLVAAPGVKFFGETPAKIGSYHGAAYQLTVDGDKTLMIALAWGKFTVTITGRAKGDIEHSAELISSAVQSFEFVSSTAK